MFHVKLRAKTGKCFTWNTISVAKPGRRHYNERTDNKEGGGSMGKVVAIANQKGGVGGGAARGGIHQHQQRFFFSHKGLLSTRKRYPGKR